MLQVSKRDRLLAVVQGMPGHASFPAALKNALTERINTWVVPMYGFNKEEELAMLNEDQLLGGCRCSRRGGRRVRMMAGVRTDGWVGGWQQVTMCVTGGCQVPVGLQWV